jgi:hypothetical protein
LKFSLSTIERAVCSGLTHRRVDVCMGRLRCCEGERPHTRLLQAPNNKGADCVLCRSPSRRCWNSLLCALRPVLVPCAPNLGSIPLNTAALLLLPDSFLTRPPGPPPARPPPPPPPALRTSTYVPQRLNQLRRPTRPTPPTHASTQPRTTFSKLDHIRIDVIPPRKLNVLHKHGPTPQTYKGQRVFEWVPQNPPLLFLSNHHLTSLSQPHHL